MNYPQKFYFFCNMLVSKNYCHLVVNNFYILSKMKREIVHFIELFRYLFGYCWTTLCFLESIRKTYLKKEHDCVFRIDVAHILPTFPISMKNIKYNPYVSMMVDDSSLQSENNIGGITFSMTEESDIQFGIITDLYGFRMRFNVFMTGTAGFDIFNGLDFDECGLGISGSVMAACLQENPVQFELFRGKNMFKSESSFDLDWSRYFSEYYYGADLDVMIKSSNPVEFLRKTKILHNQLFVNICNFTSGYAEPDCIKVETLRTIFIFVDEEFIRTEICSESLKYEDIICNLKNEKIINLIIPFFSKKIDEFYNNLFENLDEEERIRIKNELPELFEDNETTYDIHLKKGERTTNNIKSNLNLEDNHIEKLLDESMDKEEENDMGINNEMNYKNGVNITFKVKMKCKAHLTRHLEVFPVKGDDFFSIVNKFHLPCVRSYYDGKDVYLTPSCITAHKTGINMNYMYFASKLDPIEILLKYRMRGFGTLLNKNEIDKVIKYIQRVNYWNNLFDIKSKNKNSILKSLGSLSVDHKLFHVRTCNADLINEIGDVDLSDPYNNIDMTKKIVFDCDENIEKYYDKFYKGHFKFNFLNNFKTINEYGYIEPLKKFVIDTAFNIGKSLNITDKNNKESEDSNLFDSVTEAETWIPLADDDEEEPIIDSSL